MTPVTDPELLQALNEDTPARRVTDPNLLNQLNAPEPIFAPDETSLYDTPEGDTFKWIASGAKTFPGQMAASRYAAMVREPAPTVAQAQTAFDDKWYGQQIGRLTPVQKANHAALTASKIESGYDKKTAWKSAYDEMFQARQADGMKAADALTRAKRLLFGTPDDPTAYAHAVENERVRFEAIKESVREAKDSDLWKPLPGYDKPKNIIEDVLFGLGNSVLPNMLATAVSPMLGLPVMYAQIQGAAFQAMTEAGVPEEQAAQAAMWDAAGQVPLEFAGNMFMIKGILGARGWKTFVEGLVVSMGSEGLTEFAQQYPDAAAMAWALNPDITPGEMFDELASGRTLGGAVYAGIVGGVSGGLIHTVGGGVHSALTTVKQARINDNKINTVADILTRAAKGEALDEEEQALFDRLNTLATESQKRRIMYQAPIKTPNRDKVYQGLIDSKLTRERATAVMNIFDSIACSWADRVEGKLPGDFYEEVLTDYRPGTFVDFQDRIDAEGMKRAAQYGQEAQDQVIKGNTSDDNRYQSLPGSSPRGATEWIDIMQAVIHAFEGADISTPIHEAAHVMQRLMELYDPHGYAIASAFVGVKEGQVWTEQQHEDFAKSFEQYCMDGQAPTVRLRDVFAKIKSWMVDLYRRLIHGDLGITVSPEMRRVFDSWLTTEAEREAESLYELGDLDGVSETTAELSKADLDTLQEYDDLRAKAHELAIVKLGKEREKAREREMRNLRAMAVEMIEQTEFYDHLKDLKKFGGFNRASLLANGGLDTDDVAVLQGRKLINSDPGKGVNSDEFAHARGYESAEEFVRLVLDMPMAKKDAIERRYDALVADFKETVEAEMLQLSDAESLIDAEIDILNQLLNRKPTRAGRKTAAKVLGVQTDEEYQNLKIKLSAMEKAASDAYKAAMKTAKGEMVDAMTQAKEKQDAKITSLKAKHLEKVLAVKEEQKAIIARMRARNKEQVEIQKIKRGLQRTLRRKAMGFEYREQIRALLAQYMKVPKWQASDVPAVSLEQFLESKATVWGSVQLLQDARKALPSATRDMGDNQTAMRPARFSLEDWENIKDLTDSLIHMDKWEREHDTEEAKREIADLAAGIYAARGVDPASPVMGEMIARDQGQPYWQKVKEFGARHLAELRKVEFICIALDGGQRMGPVWQAVFSRVAKAYDTELYMIDDYTAKLKGVLDPFLKQDGWASQMFAFGGRQLTKEQVVLMALNSGDEYNLSKLRDGQNIRLDQESDEDCDARIHQFLEDSLSKEEWQLVYDVWGLFETLWPHIEATHHEMTGQKLKRSEGYYFPVIYDWKLSRLGVSDDRLATMDEIERLGPTGASDMIMRTPRHSARFERVGGRYPIRLEFSGISDALYSSIHDVNFTVTRRDVGRIIGSDQFRAAVENTLGEEVYEQLPYWLSEIARPSATIKSAVDRLMGWGRRAGTVAMLSFKASTSMAQVTAITQAVEEIGSGYTAEGVQQFFKNPIEMSKFINEMSIEMKHRSQNFDRDIAQLWSQLNKSKGKQVLEAVTNAGFSPIRFMDYMIAYPTWLGAYAKGVKENTLSDGSPDHDKACEYADMVVRLTQFSGATIELSKAQRGTETQKAFYMFATFFNGYYNRLVDTADRYGMGKISKFEAFKCVMLTTVLTSWLNIMLTQLRLPEGWEWLGAPINYALSGVWMARDVAGAVQGFDYRISPVAAVGKDIANAIHDTPAIMAGFVTGDFPARTARDIIFTTGYALGLPAYQAWITYQGINDLASGESQNPLDLLIRNYDVKR